MLDSGPESFDAYYRSCQWDIILRLRLGVPTVKPFAISCRMSAEERGLN